MWRRQQRQEEREQRKRWSMSVAPRQNGGADCGQVREKKKRERPEFETGGSGQPGSQVIHLPKRCKSASEAKHQENPTSRCQAGRPTLDETDNRQGIARRPLEVVFGNFVAAFAFGIAKARSLGLSELFGFCAIRPCEGEPGHRSLLRFVYQTVGNHASNRLRPACVGEPSGKVGLEIGCAQKATSATRTDINKGTCDH